MAITNYVLIDHVGYVEKEDMYSKVYAHAANLGFSKKKKMVWTMKQTCKTRNPNYDNLSPEKQNKLKYLIRQRNTPKMVYIICDHFETAWVTTESGNSYRKFDDKLSSEVNFIKETWESHGIPVAIASAQDGIVPPDDFILNDYERNQQFSKARRCAIIWGPAFNYPFSAPLYRDFRDVDNDNYFKRSDRKEMQDMLGSHITKITTNSEKYAKHFNTIASEKECEEFYEYYKALYQTGQLKDALDPGWEICPNCGRQYFAEANGDYRFGQIYIECNWCPTLNPAQIQFERFYEDSNEIEDEWD